MQVRSGLYLQVVGETKIQCPMKQEAFIMSLIILMYHHRKSLHLKKMKQST